MYLENSVFRVSLLFVVVYVGDIPISRLFASDSHHPFSHVLSL